MIKNITASVTFPISGEVLNVNFSPPPGVTAVVGENGSGKTFTGSECARWLLFGKSALRGAASDYSTLTGKGEFTIAGDDYTIERTPKKEQITDADGKVLAVGAKAVTAKVEEIFGYGLAIFDVCNASVQKDADSFGKMLPAARKRMLDRVCGLSSNEKVEKECRDKARDYRTTAETLTRTLRVPEEPVAPKRVGTEAISRELGQKRHHFNNADALRGLIKLVHTPEKPDGVRPAPEAVSALEKHQQDYAVNSAERRRLQQIITECLPVQDISYTEEQLVAAEQRNLACADLENRGDKPFIPMIDIERFRDQWAVVAAYKAKPNTEATCPQCGHTFATAGEAPWEPKNPVVELRQQEAAHQRWSAPLLPMPDGPDMTPAAINHYRKARADKERHDRAAAMLDEVTILQDRHDELFCARAAAAAWAAYDKGMVQAEAQLAINAQAEAELAKMPVVKQAEIDTLLSQLHAAETYEKEQARYAEAQAEYERTTKEIAAANQMGAAFLEGAKALNEARTELKSVLTPLLSTVASDLLFQMSNGKLRSVAVDEDMEITVDGRRIETLSGAGVTVANLALRIGLGQVLVKNTFPVFLGDEMDSDADAVRREATLAAMRSMRDRLKQIILITHREIENVDMVLNLS